MQILSLSRTLEIAVCLHLVSGGAAVTESQGGCEHGRPTRSNSFDGGGFRGTSGHSPTAT